MENLKVALSWVSPQIFRRSSPVINGETQLLVAATLLQVQQVQVLPLVTGVKPRVDASTGRTVYAVVAGATVLERLAQTQPKEIYRVLWNPCMDSIRWVYSIDIGEELSTLLELFDRSKLGAARVDSLDLHSLITLSDVIGLIREKRLVSDLTAGEVASPIKSVPRGFGLRETVQFMLDSRVRRVFVSGSERAISDRRILDFLFSPERLKIARDSPERWLDAKLEEMEFEEPARIPGDTQLNKASQMISSGLTDCLLCEEGVVTRWDLVMKPWKMRRLYVRD